MPAGDASLWAAIVRTVASLINSVHSAAMLPRCVARPAWIKTCARARLRLLCPAAAAPPPPPLVLSGHAASLIPYYSDTPAPAAAGAGARLEQRRAAGAADRTRATACSIGL